MMSMLAYTLPQPPSLDEEESEEEEEEEGDEPVETDEVGIQTNAEELEGNVQTTVEEPVEDPAPPKRRASVERPASSGDK